MQTSNKGMNCMIKHARISAMPTKDQFNSIVSSILLQHFLKEIILVLQYQH